MDYYNVDNRIVSFIESYFKKHITENYALWDYYRLNYEVDGFISLTVHYHTWEGNGLVKEYVQHTIEIPYTDIE